jgi:hypothetical protein
MTEPGPGLKSRLLGPVLGCEVPVRVRLTAEFRDGGTETLTWHDVQSVAPLRTDMNYRYFTAIIEVNGGFPEHEIRP